MTGHSHSHSAAGENRRALVIVLALTSTYLAVEVMAGLWTHSLALLADAGHMLTDVGGLGLALFAIKFGERPATPERTYGYYRVEILAALTNSVVLIGVSLFILFEAYERFRNPPQIATVPMIAVAAVGLVVNIIGVRLLQGGSSESLNIKGAYFEVMSDLLTSLGVLIAGAVMWMTGWYYADPLISAGIGLFILPRTWHLLREAVGVLLEGTPSGVNLAAMREQIVGVPGVAGVHDLHVWTLTSAMNAMSVHVVLASGAQFDAVRGAVGDRLRSEFKIAHVTIQVEQAGCDAHEVHL